MITSAEALQTPEEDPLTIPQEARPQISSIPFHFFTVTICRD